MLKIGHRGALHVAPENTIASFQKALELGSNGIELDVHVCKSGEPVVIHDDTVDRTTDGVGKVSDLGVGELQALDAGKGECIPTLVNVLENLDPNVALFIELKVQEAAKPVCEIMQRQLGTRWSYENIYIISFDVETLETVKACDPSLKLGVTLKDFDSLTEKLEEVIKVGDALPTAVNPLFSCLSEAFMDEASRLGLEVYTWVANEPEQIAFAKSLGVNGIMSDYPERL